MIYVHVMHCLLIKGCVYACDSSLDFSSHHNITTNYLYFHSEYSVQRTIHQFPILVCTILSKADIYSSDNKVIQPVMCGCKTVMNLTVSENNFLVTLKLRGHGPNYQVPHKQAQTHIQSGIKLHKIGRQKQLGWKCVHLQPKCILRHICLTFLWTPKVRLVIET